MFPTVKTQLQRICNDCIVEEWLNSQQVIAATTLALYIGAIE